MQIAFSEDVIAYNIPSTTIGWHCISMGRVVLGRLGSGLSAELYIHATSQVLYVLQVDLI
jgi:hypothetical protein